MDSSYKGAGRALILPHLEPTQRLKVLRDEGVSTLICGAISVDLLRYARQLGLTIVSGVAGEVHEVVQSYWQNTLDDPKFWLPGCRRLQRYRSGLRVGKKGLCDGEARLRGLGKRNSRRGQARAMGLGPGGFCRCPACGGKVPHEQGIPCMQVKCPRCGYIMERA
jgi:predicted Fe-Mo cluster-binding NifX family protein